MNERYSLDKLHDIVVPDMPPLWPPAVEVWLLLTILVAAVAIVVFQWRKVRRASAYRRAGLSLLRGAGTAHEISVVLKRVALAAFPRERVASLYGDDWAAFLKDSCSRRDFTPLIQAEPDSPADRYIKRLAGVWIRHHRVASGAGAD